MPQAQSGVEIGGSGADLGWGEGGTSPLPHPTSRGTPSPLEIQIPFFTKNYLHQKIWSQVQHAKNL